MEHTTERWFLSRAGYMYHLASRVTIHGEQRSLCASGMRIYSDTMTDKPPENRKCERCIARRDNIDSA